MSQDDHGRSPSGTPFFLWPLIAAAAASEAMATQAGHFARLMVAAGSSPGRPPRPDWTTPHRVRLELGTMELRDFSRGDGGTAVLVCTPFALHGSTMADFAPGHSLVQALADNGCRRLFVTDWRSSSEEMRLLTIDNYLAELNVAVDEVGAPVDLVGLCQGGVMELIFAARYPAKVRKLVLAGAPIDLAAEPSLLSAVPQHLPLGVFDEIVRLGEGRVLGRRVLDLWEPALKGREGAVVLQLQTSDDAEVAGLLRRFRDWFAWTVDLPGPYYRQTVQWLFKENRLAEGRFVALGRTVDLGEVRQPLYLLAARDDELVAPGQLLAARRLVGTKPDLIESTIEPCGHLGLFVGANTLQQAWANVARWLGQASST